MSYVQIHPRLEYEIFKKAIIIYFDNMDENGGFF